MSNQVTKRFIECLEHLKDSGKIKSYRQFARDLNFTPQNLSDMRNGRRCVTIDLLADAIKSYDINADFIFLGKGDMIMSPEAKENQLRVLPIVTDAHENERIVHVPVPAQAGYASESRNPEFIGELPSYSLPDYRFRTGTFRSFDVEGESMEPSFYEQDRVICSFVEPTMWRTSIYNGNVYIIVTRDDILLKRVISRKPPFLVLHSDNPEFEPYEVHLNDVKEIWHVKYKLSSFDHAKKYQERDEGDMDELKQMLSQQSELIRVLSMQLRLQEKEPQV